MMMKLSVINIGNSKRIRLSKTLLVKYNTPDRIERPLEKEHIILRPKTTPRKGWGKAFQKMHENGDDQLLIGDVFDNETFEDL